MNLHVKKIPVVRASTVAPALYAWDLNCPESLPAVPVGQLVSSTIAARLLRISTCPVSPISAAWTLISILKCSECNGASRVLLIKHITRSATLSGLPVRMMKYQLITTWQPSFRRKMLPVNGLRQACIRLGWKYRASSLGNTTGRRALQNVGEPMHQPICPVVRRSGHRRQ